MADIPVWEHPSFLDLLQRHPPLGAMRQYLPKADGEWAFDGQRDIEGLHSSYSAHGYGSIFYALIRVLRPARLVECGLFEGYSLLSAGAALRDNGAGRIDGYDLFEAYPYRHAVREQVARQVTASGLGDVVHIHSADAGAVHALWDAVDYLHVDVSNNGDTYRRVFEQWASKVRQVIVLEGGSVERDNVEWMRRYDKPAIVPALADLEAAYPDWSFGVLEPFPSMTIACNRRAIGSP
jgi:predicted O-methyltransferase YrrM